MCLIEKKGVSEDDNDRPTTSIYWKGHDGNEDCLEHADGTKVVVNIASNGYTWSVPDLPKGT